MVTFERFALMRTRYESATKSLNFSFNLVNQSSVQFRSVHLCCLSPLHLITFPPLLSAPLRSAHGVVEESGDRGVLPANGVGDGAGVRAVLQIQER